MKVLSYRTCVITKEKLLKQDLIRLIINKENEVIIDKNHNLAGRGFYIKKEKEVIDKLIKSKYIQKRFKVTPDESIYTILYTLV